MPENISDRREELFNINSDVLCDPCGDPVPCLLKEDAIKVMDEYFTERALELLQYMAKLGVSCGEDSYGYYFIIKNEEFTKEQLFDNFL